jgi:hypothetical protein
MRFTELSPSPGQKPDYLFTAQNNTKSTINSRKRLLVTGILSHTFYEAITLIFHMIIQQKSRYFRLKYLLIPQDMTSSYLKTNAPPPILISSRFSDARMTGSYVAVDFNKTTVKQKTMCL